MSHIDQGIAKKIRDLLALRAGATSLGEATAAAVAAQRLMDKHRIAMADLADPPAKAPSASSQVWQGRRREQWAGALACALARLNFCLCVTDTFRGGFAKSYVVGQPEDVEVTLRLYAYLSGAIRALAKGRSRAEAASFKMGAQRGVILALTDQRDAMRQGSTALARDGWSEALQEEFGVTRQKIAVRMPRSADAFLSGVAVGRAIVQNMPRKCEKALPRT